MAMTNIKPVIKDNIANTLFIPLYMRAVDAQADKPILNDKNSLKLVQTLDYNFDIYAKRNLLSRIGSCVRAKYMDEQVEQFITEHMQQHPVVVNVGCGLDDRYGRVSNAEQAVFYELDLPEVIELRRQLIPVRSNQTLVSGSAFATEWMDDLLKQHPDSAFIFVIEGVLMYFVEDKARQLLCGLADRFANAQIVFDGLNVALSKQSKHHDTVKNSNATFAWGFDDNAVFETWHPKLKFSKVFNIMYAMRKYSWIVTLLSLIPVLGKGSKIITLIIQK